MRKRLPEKAPDTFNYSLCIILLTIISLLFISGCSAKSGPEGKAWYQCASKYDQAHRIMIANAAAEKKNFLQDWSDRNQFKKAFLQAKQPTEAEIISILRAPDRRMQRIGLAAMSITPIETDQMADVLFEFLTDQDPAFRWYTFRSLKEFSNFSEIKQADLGGKLLEIVKAGKWDELFPEGLALLAKFPSEETALFLTEQMMREGEESRIRALRYLAFTALKEMGGTYYDNAVKYVNKHGTSEIKKKLLDWENLFQEKNVKVGKEWDN